MPWNKNREGVALQCLFDSGETDPSNILTMDHINTVWENHRAQFSGVDNKRTFQRNYRKTASDYITNKGMQGTRRDSTRAPPNVPENTLPTTDNEPHDVDGKQLLVQPFFTLCSADN